jgi:hypothetical protein
MVGGDICYWYVQQPRRSKESSFPGSEEPCPISQEHSIRLCDECTCKERIHNLTIRCITWRRAQFQVSASNSTNDCQACHLDLCLADYEGQGLRFDEAAPRVSRTISHRLSSIPKERTISESVLKENVSASFQPDLFFTCNPTIILISKDISLPNAAYIATFRVTNIQGCGFEIPWTPGYFNYLGLAMLDRDLQMLVDVVIGLYPKRFGKRMVANFRDLRLFSHSKGQLLLSESYFVYPIAVTTSPTSTIVA